MKVLLVNGSRREKGCTYTALNVIAEELKKNGIDSEIFYVGMRAVNGEVNELVKEAADKMADCDGIIVGSPVYYASPTGEVEVFLDRLFYNHGDVLRYKPAASVASARRGGTTATFDALNKYYTITEMPIVSSNYWNMVHGKTPEDVLKDEEGVQVMQILARNMAWILKSIEAGKKAGVAQPQGVEKKYTNFIR
ncbi:MAG: flavodoxin family protein [Firmicutes bacterium]|nr:flavodoxin family protein [Bacillota bacterium]